MAMVGMGMGMERVIMEIKNNLYSVMECDITIQKTE